MIEHVTREEILRIRHSVLRPSLAPDAAKYPQDSHPEVFHLAQRDDDGTIIACVTFFPEALDGESASHPRGIPTTWRLRRSRTTWRLRRSRTWRLRGMATVAEHRNQGLGGRLLEAGVDEVVRRGGKLVWCHGRSAATPFYQRHGFVIRGEEFELPLLGWQFLLVRELT